MGSFSIVGSVSGYRLGQHVKPIFELVVRALCCVYTYRIDHILNKV